MNEKSRVGMTAQNSGIPGQAEARDAYPSLEELQAELLRAAREEEAQAARPSPEPQLPAQSGADIEAVAPRAEKPYASQSHYPSMEAMEAELNRVGYKRRFWRILLSTVEKLIVVAAIAVLVATIWLPVLRIYGTSMTPTLNAGDIVVTFKGSSFDTGDVVGLYVGNRLLVKRVIAGPGQWVDIADDGTVYVDGKLLDEPYLTEKALGDCNIELPYQVPEGRYFVMGDHRATSVDSRHTTVGCVADDEIVGRIMFRVWPLSDLGGIEK